MKAETKKMILGSVVLAAIFSHFTVQGVGHMTLPGEVVGLEIATVPLVLNYYFRKKSPTETE